MRLFALTIIFSATATVALAQEKPIEIGSVEAATEVHSVEQLGLPNVNGVLTVSGDKVWNSYFVPAEKIEFEAGAKLIFSQEAIAIRGNLFILAKHIVSKSPENPGVITWQPSPLRTPPDRGNANSAGGYPGDEAVGKSGNNGGTGNQGYAGENAPTLTMVVSDPGSPLIIDLSGQSGGSGGKGENGGRGGVGGNGREASQNAFNCVRGAGDGGRGGSGGQGGAGGTGGSGGNGGTFKLITSEEKLPLASSLYRVLLSPGQGGAAGIPGGGGPGGVGGQGGKKALPFCRENGSDGQLGATGQTGPVGAVGATGQPGDYIIGGISAEDVTKVLVGD